MTILEFFMNLNTFPEGQALLANLLLNSYKNVHYHEVIQHYYTIVELYRLQELGLIDSSWQYYAMSKSILYPYRCDGLLWSYNENLNDFITFQYKYKIKNPYMYETLNNLHKNYIDTNVIQIGANVFFEYT